MIRSTFKEHINCKVKKANPLAGMLRISFTHFDKDMFKQLFVAIVRPRLEYGASIWNPHSKEQITSIENVQRRATKQVQTFSDIPYKERLKAMSLPTLQYRRYRGDMIEVYKISHGFYDENIYDFVQTIGSITSESIASIYQRRATRKNCENFPSDAEYRQVEQPSRFRWKTTSINMFKNHLDKP